MPRKNLVLIVETDDLIRHLLRQWLEEAGFATRLEGMAPRDAQAPLPDLVIANVAQPRQAAALIRALALQHAAPVLVISARFRRGLARSAESARRLGARGVLPKPFTREELLLAVAEALAARDRRPGR